MPHNHNSSIHMAVNSPNSPRQKMINLMYLVFIAMLALNVSVEVLDGFDLVDDSLGDSSNTMLERNKLIMEELSLYHARNPGKAGEWHHKGQQVRIISDSLSEYIRDLKLRMVRQADGRKGNIEKIKHKDDLEAASVVMLSPIKGEGKNFREALNRYRDTITQLVADPRRRVIIEKNLGTQSKKGNKSWEASLFEQMPLAAAVTILTKIENDVRASEGEALASILHSVDVGDFRVNSLNAYVIPESNIVIQGGSYNARIVLSAEDSTRHHRVVVNGSNLESGEGFFAAPATSIGTFPVQGYIEMTGSDGSVVRRNFESSYTVIEPVATIAPTLMNVLYAGIDNEVGISVPGIAPQDVSAAITHGTLSRRGNSWLVRPGAVGQNVTITVSARTSGGEATRMAAKEFRVRALPDPTPYIEQQDANGNPVMVKGGSIPKATLLQSDGLKAAIDDGILYVPFQVRSFRTVFFDAMGNAIPEVSDGSRFSDRQREQIRRLTRGSYFYISGVRATGPDGTEREIAVMELRVN